MADRDPCLEAVRREIDALDTELLGLLNRRAVAALKVAAVKDHQADPRYYRPERETALLRRLAASNAGPLPDAEAVRLFREIVSTCRALEQRLAVACATVAGACAAIGHFGGAVDLHAVPDAAGALATVADTRCEYAVVEFSPGGEVDPAVADAAGSGLVLCGEWYAAGGERYVIAGREPVPPTGDDWTSLVVAADRTAGFESRCMGLHLMVRSTPVAGRASAIGEVAAHADEPRLAGLLAEYGEHAVLGAYPNVRADGGRE